MSTEDLTASCAVCDGPAPADRFRESEEWPAVPYCDTCETEVINPIFLTDKSLPKLTSPAIFKPMAKMMKRYGIPMASIHRSVAVAMITDPEGLLGYLPEDPGGSESVTEETRQRVIEAYIEAYQVGSKNPNSAARYTIRRGALNQIAKEHDVSYRKVLGITKQWRTANPGLFNTLNAQSGNRA